MMVVNLLPGENASSPEEKHHTIEVPEVCHEEAQAASDLAELIKERYDISDDDFDFLYNAMVKVFLRGKQLSKN